MNKIIIKQISETKWFSLYDKIDNLTKDEFTENICEECKMFILLQYFEGTVGIYGIIKGKGIYSFTTKNDVFSDDIVLETRHGIQGFLLNEKQNINTFVKFLEKFFNENNKKIKKDIELVFYQDEILKYIN